MSVWGRNSPSHKSRTLVVAYAGSSSVLLRSVDGNDITALDFLHFVFLSARLILDSWTSMFPLRCGVDL